MTPISGGAKVLVTGAGGVLGRRVVRAVQRRGADVRGLGRGEQPQRFTAEWAQADLLSGDGLDAALTGVDVVVHAASDPFAPGADVQAARRLASGAHAAGVSRIVFVQIAGIADAARVSAYYRDKLQAEEVLKLGVVPCAVAAATQFHDLVDRLLTALALGPFQLSPGFTLQPVDATFFAERLTDAAEAEAPQDLVVHGPQKLTSREVARAWLAAHGQRRVMLPFPRLGPFKAFGRVRQVDGVTGGRSWSEWLRQSVDERGA